MPDEIVIPWDPERTWPEQVKAQAAQQGRIIAGVAFLAAMFPAWLLTTDQHPLAKALDVLLIVGIVALAVWGYRRAIGRPDAQEHRAVTRMLLSSPEHAGAYACLKGACDALSWFVDEKSVTAEGKPLVRRIYPSVEFIVDLDLVRAVLASQGQPDAPTLGQEIRLRIDTTKAALDSEKLAKGVPVFRSKLGLNGFETSVDHTRGETRHVDVRIARYPEGDLYARYGRK